MRSPLWGGVFGQCLPSSRVFRLTPVQPIQYKPPRKLVDLSLSETLSAPPPILTHWVSRNHKGTDRHRGTGLRMKLDWIGSLIVAVLFSSLHLCPSCLGRL